MRKKGTKKSFWELKNTAGKINQEVGSSSTEFEVLTTSYPHETRKKTT